MGELVSECLRKEVESGGVPLDMDFGESKRRMNLKNYTSDVPVSRTVARIEEVLAQSGACSVSKEFGPDGSVLALRFELETPNGKNVFIRLPADPDKVFKVLSKEVKKPKAGTMDRIREQSARTAWKLMQDWVEVQVSLIRMEQAEALEVFMPYVLVSRHQTLFQQLKESQYKALLPEYT